MTRRTKSHFRGCLLGGAVGDALGAPCEFLSLAQLRRVYGSAGITDFAPAYGGAGRWTDDTQLSLATLEGLLRARAKNTPLIEEAHRAYLRWLHTQGAPWDAATMGEHTGLVEIPTLHSQRAPGSTCLSALESGLIGTVEHPSNNSAGCGAVMRVAPVGLAGFDDAFAVGVRLGAITHGGPSGYLPAGFMAMLIRELVEDRSLPDAVAACRERLAHEHGHEETSAVVAKAVALAKRGAPAPETLDAMGGGGWHGHDALAMALVCAMTAAGFEDGVVRAVNHSGDSDSTGAITGNILGIIHGENAIPARWRKRLELVGVIRQIADELWSSFGEGANRER